MSEVPLYLQRHTDQFSSGNSNEDSRQILEGSERLGPPPGKACSVEYEDLGQLGQDEPASG